nr:two-component regulator propeller domain-containing protein [uncultured Carboxylicivirga sp.]
MKFKYFNQKEGLSNTFITSIVKDSTGYIWVGTINGLNRFDGSIFKSYYDNVKDSTQLRNYSITDLLIDKKGTLWVATLNGLHSYNKLEDNFKRYRFNSSVINNESVIVEGISTDSYGDMYVSVGSVIYKYNEATDVLDPYLDIRNGLITNFVFDKNGNIWIGAIESGLFYFESDSNILKKFPIGSPPSASPSMNVQKVLLKNDVVWLATRGKGLVSYNIKEQVFKQHPINQPDTEHIIDIMIDNSNQLWTIDYTGLKLFDEKSDTFYGYYYYGEDPQSIRPSPSVIFQDDQDNIWVGHNGEGLGLRVPPSGFHHISNNHAEYWHLDQAGVNSITKDGKGNLWIANSRPGISIFNYEQNKIEEKWYQPGVAGCLGSGTVFCLFTDSEKQVWVGTYEGGLARYEEKSASFISFKNDESDSTTISSNDVRFIDEDRDGNLWMVTYGKGVDKLEGKQMQFTHFNPDNSGLANPYVNTILCAENGDLWAGTVWGLSCKVNGESQFENFYFNSNDSNTISSNNVFVLFEDSRHHIWVGTDNGLNCYKKNEQNFHRVVHKSLKTTICGIQEDDNGNIWVSTYNGIVKINVNTTEIQLFDGIEVLGNNSLIPRSSFKSEDGRIYFGGTKGITHFEPKEVQTNIHAPDVVLTNLYVLNQSTDVNDSTSIINKNINYTDYFEVDYEDKIITFEYLGLSYNNPADNVYKYKLEGLHEDWQGPTKQTSVSFTNLSAGTYTFYVNAANNNGVWNQLGKKITFRVKPPWYRTTGSIIVILLFVLLLIWGVLNVHSLRIRRHRKLLAIQVHEKTSALRQTNDELLVQTENLDYINKLLENQSKILSEKTKELEASNLRLSELNKTKDQMFSIISHDLIGPFNTILGMTDLLMAAQGKGESKERASLAHNVNLSASRIFELLQNLLLWAKSQTQEVKILSEDFNVRIPVEESIEFLHEAMVQKSIQLNLLCDEDLIAYGDVAMFKTIVRNLVSNAIKFTGQDGKILVNIYSQKGEVHIVVEDNGVGMSKEKAMSLFDKDGLESTVGTRGESGTGIGLFLCKELVSKNNGKISVVSTEGEGTKFVFTIPKSDKML